MAEGSRQLQEQCYTARRTGEKPTTHGIYSLAKRVLASQLGIQSTHKLVTPVLTDVQTPEHLQSGNCHKFPPTVR